MLALLKAVPMVLFIGYYLCWGFRSFVLRPTHGSLPNDPLIDIRSGAWKSGLAPEAVTRVLRQLEQNGQVLRNPYNICKILVYSSFGYVEN